MFALHREERPDRLDVLSCVGVAAPARNRASATIGRCGNSLAIRRKRGPASKPREAGSRSAARNIEKATHFSISGRSSGAGPAPRTPERRLRLGVTARLEERLPGDAVRGPQIGGGAGAASRLGRRYRRLVPLFPEEVRPRTIEPNEEQALPRRGRPRSYSRARRVTSACGSGFCGEERSLAHCTAMYQAASPRDPAGRRATDSKACSASDFRPSS